jgi:hypothetical protein
MIGFDERRARKACERFFGRLVLPCVTALFILCVVQERDDLLAKDWLHASLTLVFWAAFVYGLFGLLPLKTHAAALVASAKKLHLYGQPVRGTLVGKPRLITSVFGLARVELPGPPDDGPRRVWCLGMPADFARLRVGDPLIVIEDTRLKERLAKGKSRVWLPFWLPEQAETPSPTVDDPGALEEADPARPVMAGIAEAVLPIEQQVLRAERATRFAAKPVGCVVLVVALIVCLPHAGWGFALGFAAVLAVAQIVDALGKWKVRAVARAACETFDKRFPKGTPERKAAMMILNEDKKATPAWAALCKALARQRAHRQAG